MWANGLSLPPEAGQEKLLRSCKGARCSHRQHSGCAAMTFAVGGVSQNVCVAKVTPKATFLMTKRRPKKVRPGSKYAGSVSYLFLVCNASPPSHKAAPSAPPCRPTRARRTAHPRQAPPTLSAHRPPPSLAGAASLSFCGSTSPSLPSPPQVYPPCEKPAPPVYTVVDP